MRKILFFLILFISTGIAYSSESILEFNSEVTVNIDRSFLVKETIKVKVEGNQIQRGIFRKIPVLSVNERGVKKRAQMEVTRVTRNGQDEPFSLETAGSDITIRIGDANVFLDHTIHTYEIEYILYNQVRFFEAYDEIYWNVTGNYWDFVIEQASVSIRLPEGAEGLQHSSYSGYYGDTGCDCEELALKQGIWTGSMRSGLEPGMGYTVSIGFTRGLVQAPTAEELRAEMILRNRIFYLGIAGLFVVLLYLIDAWVWVGRDPAKGVIIPRFDPPQGFSPAACRNLFKMRFDHKALTSILVNLAVKGALIINKTGNRYVLKRTNPKSRNLLDWEKKIMEKLFGSKEYYELKTENYSGLRSANKYLESHLEKQVASIYFRINAKWLTPAVVLSILLVLWLLVWVFAYDDQTFFSAVIGMFVALFISPFLAVFLSIFRSGSRVTKIIIAVILSVIVLFFSRSIVELYHMILESSSFDGQILLFLIGIVVLLVFFGNLFGFLLKAPTKKGRELMDQIEGLILYMEMAEKDRLNLLNPPEQNLQHFETLLPYAIALDVESKWAERFESVLQKAMESGEKINWYKGDTRAFRLSSFTSNVSSRLNSAVSSYSSPPSSSSSSGSSGGGSSGGGSGGGGGGGW